MSNARWCDVGQHAFPEGQPGSTTLRFTRQVKNQWGGYQPTDEASEACASCARDTGLVAAAPVDQTPEQLEQLADEQRARSGGRIIDRVKAITSGNGKGSGTRVSPQEAEQRGYDPDYVKWLEQQESKPLPDDDLDERIAAATRHPASGGAWGEPVA